MLGDYGFLVGRGQDLWVGWGEVKGADRQGLLDRVAAGDQGIRDGLHRGGWVLGARWARWITGVSASSHLPFACPLYNICNI